MAARRPAPAVDYREILPEVLAQVAEAAGLEAALALRRQLGGTPVNVAREPKPGTLLVETIGLEAARAVAALYGGETVPLPKGKPQEPALIRHLLGLGWTVNAVARTVGCTDRQVRRVKNGATEPMPLFAGLAD